MNKPINLHFTGSGLRSEDLTQLFNPVVRSEYANTMVFHAPVNPEQALLRAIEALRTSTQEPAAAQNLPLLFGA